MSNAFETHSLRSPKERPILFSGPMVRAILSGAKTQTRRVVKVKPDGAHGPCPYGGVGDRLWVRESCALWRWNGQVDRHCPSPVIFADDHDVWPHRAEQNAALAQAGYPSSGWKTTPSIHMPRWASRLSLEITAVRVERLQAISGQDCLAEGVTLPAVATYRDLWDSLNAKRGYGWDVNPWVWAVEFRRVEQALASNASVLQNTDEACA